MRSVSDVGIIILAVILYAVAVVLFGIVGGARRPRRPTC